MIEKEDASPKAKADSSMRENLEEKEKLGKDTPRERRNQNEYKIEIMCVERPPPTSIPPSLHFFSSISLSVALCFHLLFFL